MPNYRFILRPTTKVRSAHSHVGNVDKSGHAVPVEDLGDMLLVETENRVFEVTVGNVSTEDDAELCLELEDDEAARGLALALNDAHVDPWRVDFVFGPDGEEVYVD